MERRMWMSVWLLAAMLGAVSVGGLPLSTSGRWVVDGGGGQRVKLACVNWPAHLEPVVAEGLSKRPVDEIAKAIRGMGFNCVRLTWPTFLPTGDASLAGLTVRSSFSRLGLNSAGVQRHNPALIDLPLLQAFQAVVSSLEENDVMVVLDNHLSKPGWCCSRTDGNGFFGDTYFDPGLWVEGLRRMAALFRSHPNVVGMSLRNELRGSRQNVDDWFRYMQMGAEAVHAANPDVLVILSGLNFDSDLGFLSSRPLNVSFSRKIVFEMHWYSFTNSGTWAGENANDACGSLSGGISHRVGFLLDRGFPLFLSEFGMEQSGRNERDNRFFSCALAYAAEHDLDWALWALQGSYYLRQGVADSPEAYGMLTSDWWSVRNRTLLGRIRSIQQPFRGPGVAAVPPYKTILHPLTGLCVTIDSSSRGLALAAGPCGQQWRYGDDRTLSLADSSACVTAVGAGKPPRVGNCGGSGGGGSSAASTWVLASASHMHVSTRVEGDNRTLCMDVGGDGRSVVTNPCRCMGGDAKCDPEGQWFRLVTTARLVG
ncbi:glycosyl hydrolase 5 family protein-like [Zingiber officinale]|uniref:glycosyl hydrolase 5 family protein-like n=1 Tax=Zingiber officinale TaxID=94328 RepID=UPI001C4D4216|nr:glycosyl hydrolase 5 family protein-like [Zingiber officinale]